MYIEFGIGEWLEQRPFLYAITHQVSNNFIYGDRSYNLSCIILLILHLQLSIFVMAMFIGELGGASWRSPAAFLMGSIALSGFFTYEVCRKLDPTHPKVNHRIMHVNNWSWFNIDLSLSLSLLPFLQIKGTYLIVCGKWSTFFFTFGTVSIGVVSSLAAGLHWMLWPLEGLMIMVSTSTHTTP